MDDLGSKLLWFLAGTIVSFLICLLAVFFIVDVVEKDIAKHFHQEAVDHGYGTMIEGEFFWVEKADEEHEDSEPRKKRFIFF
jgi:hypothetical protein